jgi:hypothetical protein
VSQTLVKNQHTLPFKSIKRFINNKGNVQVFLKNTDNNFPAKPDNEVFCLTRVWDQRSEQGYGKDIEDNFQKLVDSVLSNSIKSLTSNEHKIVTTFYLLWCLRTTVKDYDHLAKGKLNSVSGHELSEQEKLDIELQHSYYVEQDGNVPKHFKRGRSMEMAIGSFIKRNPSLQWYLCKSPEVDLIVSDSPAGEYIVPITPSLCFYCNFDYKNLTIEQAVKLNLNSIARANKYYFANDISRCIYA